MREKDLLIRGRIDTLFGNLVIEFERAIPAHLREAEDQLRRYIASLRQEEEDRERSYLGIATDGIRFHVYAWRAVSSEPHGIELREVETANFEEMAPADIYFWIDRYFLRTAGPRRPTSAEFVRDFGSRSAAMQMAMSELAACWSAVREAPDVRLLYDNWRKYLRITYGGVAGDEELFLRHTYLALLARLMVSARFGGMHGVESPDRLRAILDGRFFSDLGVENFLEEDFFSWPGRLVAAEGGFKVSRKLLAHLLTYNLAELAEDVFKSLYQDLVDPETRHDLGEYYTPDWLAASIVRHVLKDKPKARVLDPASGSGTFLYQTIRYKREALGGSSGTLKHILDSVVGFDIHPLAVTISRTNYLLALGDLRKRPSRIRIPVYMADSIRLPPFEEELEGSGRPIELHDRRVILPESLVKEPDTYDAVVRAAATYAEQLEDRSEGSQAAFGRFLQREVPKLAADRRQVQALFLLAETLRQLRKERHDSIWAFVLKNLFKPLAVLESFDAIVGNPPWIIYRFIEKGAYQKFVKDAITKEYDLAPDRKELVTAMELAALFFHRAADLYLRSEGTIAFVMPRGIFSSDQHERFRRGPRWAKVGLTGLWDLEYVVPLFQVPACVTIGRKGARNHFPLDGLKIEGRLSVKNASLDEADRSLRVSETQWHLHRFGERSFISDRLSEDAPASASVYKKRFRVGATIFPHSLVFVDIKVHPELGFDAEAPVVRTAVRATKNAKKAYKDLILEGPIEAKFLYAAYLSADIVPFAHVEPHPAVLPIRRHREVVELLTASEAKRLGFQHLARWLETAESKWNQRRGEKAGRMSFQERLDRYKNLSSQTRHKFTVVYGTSGTNLCACWIEGAGEVSYRTGAGSLSLRGVIIDQTLFHFDLDSEDEAAYLTAVLNSPSLDKAIKPMQPRGQWGPRHIAGKVFELPVPQFDPRNRIHLKLAELAKQASREAKSYLERIRHPASIGRLRSLVRVYLRPILDEIDGIAGPLFGRPPR